MCCSVIIECTCDEKPKISSVLPVFSKFLDLHLNTQQLSKHTVDRMSVCNWALFNEYTAYNKAEVISSHIQTHGNYFILM